LKAPKRHILVEALPSDSPQAVYSLSSLLAPYQPIMSHAMPSDEVAEDYTVALQNLTLNSRYEISNLTVIAKENTEHALAISEALKNHIKQVGYCLFYSY
jgi:hypothetical protein